MYDVISGNEVLMYIHGRQHHYCLVSGVHGDRVKVVIRRGIKLHHMLILLQTKKKMKK